MRYIEAPTVWVGVPGEKTLFLAGGITDCPDWQAEMRYCMADDNVTLFNPRQANFPIHDSSAAREQIRWEFQHLRAAHAILFWFPEETLCPIVLFELGAWTMTDKPLVVGTHRNYARRQDVVLQTELARPDIAVHAGLDTMLTSVRAWLDFG